MPSPSKGMATVLQLESAPPGVVESRRRHSGSRLLGAVGIGNDDVDRAECEVRITLRTRCHAYCLTIGRRPVGRAVTTARAHHRRVRGRKGKSSAGFGAMSGFLDMFPL